METDYTLDEIIKKYNITLEEGYNTDLFLSILNGKFNKYTDSTDPIILAYIGMYYQLVKQSTEYDLKSMEKYYLKSLEYCGDINDPINYGFKYYVMYSLGRYYQITKDHVLMDKYYQMVINSSHYTSQYASLALGNYYRSIKPPTSESYTLMKKYYIMTIDFKYNNFSLSAVVWLADYYRTIEKNYVFMKLHLETALINADVDNPIYDATIIYILRNLGHYYKNIEKDIIKTGHYLLKAIERATNKSSNNHNNHNNNDKLLLSTYNMRKN